MWRETKDLQKSNIYIERDELKEIFRETYESLAKDMEDRKSAKNEGRKTKNAENRYVINYYGPVGIGKSWLCQHLYNNLSPKADPYDKDKLIAKSTLLDLRFFNNNCDKINVLEHLANKLENECKYSFPIFKYGLYVYYRAMGKSHNSPEIERIQDNPIVGVALECLQNVPLVGSIGASIIKTVDIIGAEVRKQITKNKLIIEKLDILSLDQIPNELYMIFCQELRESTINEDSPVVIFLDTYEKIQNYIPRDSEVSDDWIWSESGLIQNIPNVLWVLAGRTKVAREEETDEESVKNTDGEEDKEEGSEEDADKNIIRIICKSKEIGKIEDETKIRGLFSGIDIEDENTLDIIVKKTKGIPMYITMCREYAYNLIKSGKTLKADDFDFDIDKDFESLTRRCVSDLDFVSRDVLDTLVCLESWSEKELVDLRISAYAYEHILHLSFFVSDKDMYSIYDYIQRPLYKSCSKFIQNQVLRYFEEKVKDASVTTGDRQEYVLKKIKLQFNMLNTVLDSRSDDEFIKGKVNGIIAENLTYIQQFLLDRNFLLRVEDLIFNDNSDICDKYLEDDNKKIFDIYDFYYCIVDGDYKKIQYYMEVKKINFKNRKLDDVTKRFLYVSLGSYYNQMNNTAAENDLLEAYSMWKESDDLYIYTYLDLMVELGRLYIKGKDYSKVIEYSDQGIDKAANKFKQDGKLKLDTKSVVSYCELFVNKAIAERLWGNVNNTLEYLVQAEAALEPFEEFDNGEICCERARIYQQYAYVYEEFVFEAVMGDDLRKEYTQQAFDSAQKASELNSSPISLRTFAIACNMLAKIVPTTERKELFDKSIALMDALYERQPGVDTYNEMFMFIREAADYVSDDIRKEYLDKCSKLLETESEYKIGWKEIYDLYRAELSYRLDNGEYDAALEKLECLEVMLDKQKNRLSGEDYLAYQSRNHKARGDIYERQEYIDKAIESYKKQYDKESDLYKTQYFGDKKYLKYADGVSYSDSCVTLASAYVKKMDFDNAARYAQYQRDIVKEKRLTEDRYMNRRIMQNYIKSLNILTEYYEQKQKVAEVLGKNEELKKLRKTMLEICNEELKYTKILCENENWDESSNKIYDSLKSALVQIRDVQIRQLGEV